MSFSKRIKWVALLAALSAGTAWQVGTNGCYQYYGTMAASAFDFCSVFNCTGGTYFNFCTPVRMLSDCPGVTINP